MWPMMHMATTTQQRTAVVTGGSRGIGHAIADRLRTRTNYHVIALDRRHGDLSSPSDVSFLCERVASWKPSILVNCAGISIDDTMLATTATKFDTTYNVNVRAPFLLAQAVLPSMLQHGWGRIVNIGSIYGIVSRAHRAAYTVSKHALHGLTLALSAEFAEAGVLTNTVSPGVIDTDMTRNRMSDEERRLFATRVPASRIGQPAEVASLVAWLVSEENTYVTGQNIAIDGGFTGV